MGPLDDAMLDVHEEDIGTGGFMKAFTGAAALVDAGELKVGRYYMLSDQAVWVKRGDSNVVAAKAVATEFKLAAGVYWPVRVTAQDMAANSPTGASRAYFSVIADSTSGTVLFLRVDRS
jgi:hypothetical protein